MLRLVDNLARGPDFHNLPRVEHRDAPGDIAEQR
jgi:hypothetical protein